MTKNICVKELHANQTKYWSGAQLLYNLIICDYLKLL